MKTACVTGGSGYIASALIRMLLERGYAVKSTVRNPGLSDDALCSSLILYFGIVVRLPAERRRLLLNFVSSDDMAKNSHLKDLQALGPLTVLRADLDVEGSFDDAVAGCDYAFLVAASVNIAAGEDLEVRRLAS